MDESTRNTKSRLMVTFVPDGPVLKAVVGGMSSLDEALAVIDRIAHECAQRRCDRVLAMVKLVSSNLPPQDYARMASHAVEKLKAVRFAILVPMERTAGQGQLQLLSPNFRVYFDEVQALRWLNS